MAAEGSWTVFWAEWDGRAPGETRSLDRARLLVTALGFEDPGRPVLTVVGSKGKGTAATYASAYLVAAGLQVVMVTSPDLRGPRDRIRLDGQAVSERDLASLAERLDAGRRTLPHRPSTGSPPRKDDGPTGGEAGLAGGYLSPSGLFLIAGVLYAKVVDADVIVLEAGMGGASDEVSLFPPTVVAITPVFGEHLGVLGDTSAEIATDKAGVVAPITRAVLSAPQDSQVEAVIQARVGAGTDGPVGVEVVEPGTSGLPAHLLPPGLGRSNAELGCVAARRLLDAIGRQAPPDGRLSGVLASVAVPGRGSWHDVPGTTSRIFADAAINRAGIAAALAEVSRHWTEIDRVLLCLPDHKDLAGAIAELAAVPVTFVRLTGDARLRFTHALPPGWEVLDIGDVDREFLAARGPRLVALGTGYFIARILDLVGADTDRLFLPPDETLHRPSI
jgi:dihydrofolate synthase/folylpolyglutamate synthase